MRMPPPPPMPQPYDPTRGIISCFTTQHGAGADDTISGATDQALRNILVDHYDEAFRRLPVHDVPADVDLGDLCLGLLDPVTNIVLNAISLLPHGFELETNPSPPRRQQRGRDGWRAVVWRSRRCLLEFMRAYFGLLTEEQAGRYLVWARGDLTLAVLLVEHELYAPRPAPPDPSSGRTRNSLRIAATHWANPSPDHLVSLATLWLPQHRLEMLAPILRDGGVISIRGRRISYSGLNRLTVDNIKTFLHAIRHKDDVTTTIVQPAGDYIASLRRPQDTQFMLSSYSMHASAVTVPPCTSVQFIDGDADASVCPYLKSLEMSLYGTIHGFYLRALAMLPSHHVRGVLVAGHCYGPMDPVSNIVLTAIWFGANFPLSLSDSDQGTQAHDILDTLTMLRAMSRSLRGLVALLHATSDQLLSLHGILKYLCYAQGDLSAILQPYLHHQRLDERSPNLLVAAATAAEHPQASALAAFFVSLAPAKLDRIRALIMSASANNTVLSQESLTQINCIVKEETSGMMIKPSVIPPKLCGMALNILTRKRKAYAYQQSFIRGRIEKALQEYRSRHPSEPKYNLNFVCGVAIAGHMDQCYHVNFMAATKSSIKNTLFFAEFLLAYEDQSKPSICYPLLQPYDMVLRTGRCYYSQESARKIAYPDHLADYFSSDVTRGGLNDIEGVLDTDFIYFDSMRDVELAKVLQRMAKKEEVLQMSSTGRPADWPRGIPAC